MANVDAEREVLALIGCKEGLFHISLAYVGYGDIGLVPDPAFPAYNDAVSPEAAAELPYAD